MKLSEMFERFEYYKSCVDHTQEEVPLLDDMIDAGEQITYDEFIYAVSENDLKEMFPTYDWDNEGGLKLKNDWAVRFYRSIYDYKRAYYMDHSAIEYVWLEE